MTSRVRCRCRAFVADYRLRAFAGKKVIEFHTNREHWFTRSWKIINARHSTPKSADLIKRNPTVAPRGGVNRINYNDIDDTTRLMASTPGKSVRYSKNNVTAKTRREKSKEKRTHKPEIYS